MLVCIVLLAVAVVASNILTFVATSAIRHGTRQTTAAPSVGSVAPRQLRGLALSRRGEGVELTRRRVSAKEPWKPLVFKFPKKKPPRDTVADDDGFTTQMRERLGHIPINDEVDAGEQRAVKDTKISDFVSKEVENAKINANYALWVVDRTHDKRQDEEQHPDLEAMRGRFQDTLKRLEDHSKPRARVRPIAPSGEAPSNEDGLSPQRSIDELVAAHPDFAAVTHEEPAEHEAEQSAALHGDRRDDDIIDYLEGFQKQSAKEQRLSKRVVRSVEERRQEYEATKVRMFAATSAFGFVGTGIGAVAFGTDEAFSFFLGSIGALLYLSGLSSYTDNAESPIATVQGGRRLLVPIILVLLVTQWYKLEILFPAVAALGLTPVLPVAILGFFTYNLGKLAAQAFQV